MKCKSIDNGFNCTYVEGQNVLLIYRFRMVSKRSKNLGFGIRFLCGSQSPILAVSKPLGFGIGFGSTYVEGKHIPRIMRGMF